jgi:hypothetical protein
MPDGLPTARDYREVHMVHVICAPCNRPARLDLEAVIAAGHGDTPLIKLPLRCSVCGGAACSISVSGSPHPSL